MNFTVLKLKKTQLKSKEDINQSIFLNKYINNRNNLHLKKKLVKCYNHFSTIFFSTNI